MENKGQESYLYATPNGETDSNQKYEPLSPRILEHLKPVNSDVGVDRIDVPHDRYLTTHTGEFLHHILETRKGWNVEAILELLQTEGLDQSVNRYRELSSRPRSEKEDGELEAYRQVFSEQLKANIDQAFASYDKSSSPVGIEQNQQTLN